MRLSSFEAIVKALNDAGARYIVVGGLAVNAHGYQRLTHDVDFVIQLQPENIRHDDIRHLRWIQQERSDD